MAPGAITLPGGSHVRPAFVWPPEPMLAWHAAECTGENAG
jgi:hypothetical protein